VSRSGNRRQSIKKPNQSPVSQQQQPREPEAKQHIIHQKGYSGPIPDPGSLDRYNQIVPGAAERIISMAESEAKHRHTIETMAIASDVDQRKRGQWFGFVIGTIALLASIYAIFKGQEKAAMVIGGTTVVGLVSVFVLGRIIPPK
jgi:uncharacterized membrane protein